MYIKRITLLTLMVIVPTLSFGDNVKENNNLEKKIQESKNLKETKKETVILLKDVNIYINKKTKRLKKSKKDLKWLKSERDNKKITKYNKRIFSLINKNSKMENEIVEANLLKQYLEEKLNENVNDITITKKEIDKNEVFERLRIKEDIVMLPNHQISDYIDKRLYPVTNEITKNKLQNKKNGYRTLIMRDNEDIVVKKAKIKEEQTKNEKEMKEMKENITELESKIYSPKLLEVQTNEKVIYKVKFVDEKAKIKNDTKK